VLSRWPVSFGLSSGNLRFRTYVTGRSSSCKLLYGRGIRGASPRGCSSRGAFPRKIVLSRPLDEALNQQGGAHEKYEVKDELPILHDGLTNGLRQMISDGPKNMP
jgi:hypothetical protein